MQECVMFLSGDTPRLLELESLLELYVAKTKPSKEVNDEDVKK